MINDKKKILLLEELISLTEQPINFFLEGQRIKILEVKKKLSSLSDENYISSEDLASQASKIISSYVENLNINGENTRVLRGKWLKRAEQEIGELIINIKK